MTQRQIVTGFFENKAEAQQAVQRLLDTGFRADQVSFLTPTESRVAGMSELAPTTQERSSGRFFFALFGHSEAAPEAIPSKGISGAKTIHGSAAQVSVAVYSSLEVDQAVELLKGAWEVTIHQPLD